MQVIMKYIKRFFHLRNFIFFIIVLISVIAAFGASEEAAKTIIIMLLGLIGAELILTNITYLGDIEQKLDNIQHLAFSIDPHLKQREERTRKMSDLLVEARCIRISGISLQGLFNNFRGEFIKAAERGTRIEFMIANPDAAYLDEIDKLRNDGDDFRKNLRKFIKTYYEEVPIHLSGQFEIKLSAGIPYQSIIQVNFKNNTPAYEYMVVDLYAFGAEVSYSLELTRQNDTKAFDYFSTAEQDRWEDAMPLAEWLAQQNNNLQTGGAENHE